MVLPPDLSSQGHPKSGTRTKQRNSCRSYPKPTKLHRKAASKFHDIRESDPDKEVQLTKKNLNVSAGRKFYEKAASRHARWRLALLKHSHISRDRAIPLKRGGARGPGLAVLVAQDCNNDTEQELLAAATIASSKTAPGRSRTIVMARPRGSTPAAVRNDPRPLVQGLSPLKRSRSNNTTETINSRLIAKEGRGTR